MKRYEKFVLKAEKGITFEVSEGTSGELIIRALNIATANVNSINYATPPIPEGYKHVCGATANVNSINYANPPIPERYKHVCGEWNNGFVIERRSDGSQFVWIPVESLKSNGTLDGEHFVEKFGRRNYMNSIFSADDEPLNDELLEQLGSVKKYGGFYISRYNISMSRARKPQSVKGVWAYGSVNFNEAKAIASTIEDNEAVKSHLTFGAEYDSVLEWLIETGVKGRWDIVKDSTEWGNYSNTKNSPYNPVKTGSKEEWCANNIYDLAGNGNEWTQEQRKSLRRVVRGGDFRTTGYHCPVAHRASRHPEHSGCEYGTHHFRAALYIK